MKYGVIVIQSNSMGKIEIMSLQLECRDIIEMISRYVASNRNKVCFIGSFIAIDEKKLEKNEDDIIKEGSDLMVAFGDKDSLRIMLNELRDIVEDEADKDGFVNI